MRSPVAAVSCVVCVLACAGCDEDLRRVPAIESPDGFAQTIAMTDRATDDFGGGLALIPLEHASLLLVWDDLAIYVDPTSPTIDDDQLPKANLILVTDAHYDHLDPLALEHLRRPSPPETIVVGSPGAGAREPLDVVMHEGETRTLTHGLVVTAVPAYNVEHGAGPGMLYHPRGQSVGYVLDFGGTRILVTGDTECTPELRALTKIGAAFVSLNVPYAMTASEATACVAAFRPKIVFPYAYRHAVPSTLDRTALGAGIEVRRREFYPRAAKARKRAYDAYAHGMWGLADDLLDEAQRLDPAGESDWRVKMTRQWLKEDENPWPW